MAATNIDEIFSQIEKDFVELSKNAARSAANKAQKEIRAKADRFIKEYYAYKPKVYQRTYSLYKLVENYYAESDKKSGIEIEFGIKYNPSNISGLHKSNSWYHQTGTHWIPRLSHDFDFDSQNHGIPSATWIAEKFIEGIHPSGMIGDDGGVKDDLSPDTKMQQFFDTELEDLVVAYINKSLLDSVAAYF
jgi:hypothetical protein